jgi:hypothetical protein
MTSTWARGIAIVCAAASATLTAAQAVPPQTGGQAQQQKPPEAKPPAKRVRVNLAGFELGQAPPPKNSTQLGGGTRSVGSGGTTLLAPAVGRSYSASPLLAWTHSATTEKFDVRIFDRSGAIAYRTVATGRELAYPAVAPPLEPGGSFQWSVQPAASLLGDPSEKSTVVRPAAAELEEIAQQLARPPAGVDPQEWKAQVFTDRRLWYDAVAAWSDMIRLFPGRAEFREKRGQIYDQLPATQALADEDFAAADRLRGGARSR